MRLLFAAALYALACFALQEVPRGHGGLTLAGIALLGASLPMLRGLAARPRPAPPPATRAVLVAALVLLGAAQVGFAVLRTAKLKLIDIGTTTFAAVTALAHGQNPYAMPIDLLAGGIAAPASDLLGYKYLLVTIAAYAPLCLVLGLRGIVVTNLILQGAVAAALRALAAKSAGPLAGLAAAAFYLAIPFFAFQLFARGANDLVPLLPLLIALLVLEERPFAAGLLVGLSLAAKLMPGAAALLCLVPGPGGRGRYAAGVLAGLLPILPFLVWNPHAFANNILLFNAIRPIDDTTWLLGLPPTAAVAARVVGAAGLAAIYLAIWRRPPRREARLAALAGSVLLVFAVGPDMHHNYYLWFLPLWAPLAAGAALGSPLRAER
jgi:hypothetical protein